ncbi:hypothetical protein CSA37_04900 [Candidatus Fermentibacteria bacterium]|nr:MAG: hypothetical protein CSA37_10190 [Candidatus Fermentibacteria bacterium]PIE52266.1 MAG: hypothetical protein CSA37_07295 [Candidatus Fermentibacteria bacterium]PIE52761.1 MAG: hypothetical protein CSA37_04900 [Candidatus Fermentibacteria bacterium]
MLITAGGFVFRTVFATAVLPPPDRMQGETTQALRYTEMVSSGQGIPEVDSLVMRPYGMNTGENSIFEEYIAGGIHRITGGDLNSFLTFFCRGFPLLLVPVLFFWMKKTGFSSGESFFAALLYAVFLPALLRTRGESLYRETVALPLIFSSLMFADISAGTRRKYFAGITGAVLFFMALAAWKVTGFIATGLFLWMLFKRPGKHLTLPYAAAQVTASLLLTHMRHDGALYSPATVLAVFSAAGAFTGGKVIRWTGSAAAACALFLSGSGATGHVTAVILAKFRFLFSHPEDPSMLSNDARLFWVSGYTSPSPGQMLLLFLPVIPAAALGWKRFRKILNGTLLYWALPVSLAGYLLFDRLHVLLAVAAIPLIVSAFWRNKLLISSAAALLGVQSMMAPEYAALLSSAGLSIEYQSSLLGDDELDSFLQWASETDGTVLSFWHISGLLTAYAETPAVTHTFFENKGNRETIISFARLMYGSEEEMVSFMEEKGARYLVYQADFIFDRSSAGLIYLAGLREVPDGSLAVRLHYYPESLERLVPVWQGPSLRVFELDGPKGVSLAREVLWERRYGPFISTGEMAFAALFNPVETGLYLANSGIEENSSEKLSAALLLFAGSPEEVPGDASVEMLQRLLTSYLSGNYDIIFLAEDFETWLDAWGPDPQLRLDLIRLLRDAGLHRRAEYHRNILDGMGRQGL